MERAVGLAEHSSFLEVGDISGKSLNVSWNIASIFLRFHMFDKELNMRVHFSEPRIRFFDGYYRDKH
jgi:hypothetical protein